MFVLCGQRCIYYAFFSCCQCSAGSRLWETGKQIQDLLEIFKMLISTIHLHYIILCVRKNNRAAERTSV